MLMMCMIRCVCLYDLVCTRSLCFQSSGGSDSVAGTWDIGHEVPRGKVAGSEG